MTTREDFDKEREASSALLFYFALLMLVLETSSKAMWKAVFRESKSVRIFMCDQNWYQYFAPWMLPYVFWVNKVVKKVFIMLFQRQIFHIFLCFY